MKTTFILMAQYETAIVPVDLVCRDYFSHMTPAKLLAKIGAGEIALPLVRIDPTSQKTAKGVAVEDLAEWIDRTKAAARKECEQLTGVRY